MYRFPEGLYSDIRIERRDNASYCVENGEVKRNSEKTVIGAIVRVYDGNMWYTSVTNDLDSIQSELDGLAALAEPNAAIADDPVVRLYEVNRDICLRFEGDSDIRRIAREQREKLVNEYIAACVDDSIEEIKQWGIGYEHGHMIKEFYSSKGAAITQDRQQCYLKAWFNIVIDGLTTSGYKCLTGFAFDELAGRSDEIVKERDKFLDYARNAVDVTPGEYVCVLSPFITGVFTHESFGHKSEADYMLNDKALREEWVMGKKVGSELVSICDTGCIEGELHQGDIAYDDEGTKPKATWLIKNGVLTGRLHDANSAAALGEELTGNSRAQDFSCTPMVRMTNTYMQAGETSPGDIIAGVKDGIYISDMIYGTGLSTFTIKPSICYRIRDGRLAEPLRVNVVTGSVFKTLFDIDAVGNDLSYWDTGRCGKNGQSMPVSASGPTVRVKSLTVN